MMRSSSIARLADPAKILEKTLLSLIPKAGVILAFEPPQKTTPRGRQFIRYPKNKYNVFVGLEGMQVRGKLNQAGPLDLRQAVTNLSESFVPITEATVTLDINPGFILKRDAILVNVQRIRFLGELEPAATPEETP